MSSTSTAEVSLRAGGYGDIPAIVAVQARSWRTAYRGLVADEFLDALPLQDWIAAWQAHLVAGPASTYCVVAEAGGRLVGFASGGATQDPGLGEGVGELHTLYIDAAYQGTGLGRRLLEDVTIELSRRGFGEAVLWVLEGNSRAQAFYARAGWRPDGATGTDCWGVASAARLRLRRPLRPRPC